MIKFKTFKLKGLLETLTSIYKDGNCIGIITSIGWGDRYVRIRMIRKVTDKGIQFKTLAKTFKTLEEARKEVVLNLSQAS